jgi:hypothetical protein
MFNPSLFGRCLLLVVVEILQNISRCGVAADGDELFTKLSIIEEEEVVPVVNFAADATEKRILLFVIWYFFEGLSARKEVWFQQIHREISFLLVFGL